MTEVQSFIRVVHWYRHRGKRPFEFLTFYANVCNYDISYIYRYRFVINET